MNMTIRELVFIAANLTVIFALFNVLAYLVLFVLTVLILLF